MKKIDQSKVKAKGVSLIIVGHVCYHKDANNDYIPGFNYSTVTNNVVSKSILHEIDSKQMISYHLIHHVLI